MVSGCHQHVKDRRPRQILQRCVDDAMETVHAKWCLQRPEWASPGKKDGHSDLAKAFGQGLKFQTNPGFLDRFAEQIVDPILCLGNPFLQL